jgi:hypothetical protein
LILLNNTQKYTKIQEKKFKYISIHTRINLNKYTYIHDTRNGRISHISGPKVKTEAFDISNINGTFYSKHI